MRVKGFDYFSSCTIILYLLIDFVKFNDTATVEERTSKSDDDFSDISVLQSNNQKFTIYRNAIKRECYVEVAPTPKTNSDQQPLSRTLFVGKSQITPSLPIYSELGQDVLDSCKNFSIFNLEERPSNTKSDRRKRQVIQPRKSYFKGQTQTQFISFDNEGKNDKGGTAEATAEQDKSRATVQGRMGMGQAQSQSGSGDPCEECAGSIRTTGQFGSAYPGSYPAGQGSGVSSQQGVNGAGQYGGGSSYPTYGVQPGTSGTPIGGAGVIGSGQNQAGTTYPSSGGQPGTSGIPSGAFGVAGQGSQGAGSFYPQQAGYPSSPNGAGGYFPGQTGAPGGQGYGQVGSGQPGYISRDGGGSLPQNGGSQNGGQQSYTPQGGLTGGFQPGGQTYTPQQGYTPTGGIESGGSQGRGGRGGSEASPPTGYVPQSGAGLGGAQGGAVLYPPGYVSQSGVGPGSVQGGGTSYPPGYVPQSGAGPGSFQGGGVSYPPGYVPQSGGGPGSVQGGGASYPPVYVPQSGARPGGPQGGSSLYPPGYIPQSRAGSGGPQGGGALYPPGYVPQSGAGSSGPQGGSLLYPPGYIPQSGAGAGSGGAQGGGILYPSGYIPQSGTGSGGAQGGGALYPPGYVPQSGAGSGGVQGGGVSYPSGYIPETGAGPGGAQGGGASYPQGYIPQSGVGPGSAQGRGTSYPSGYVPQSGAESGVQGGGTLYPPGYVPQSGAGSGTQGVGASYPPGYVPQPGVGSAGAQGGGALYPQSSGYTPGSIPQAGVGGPQGGAGISQGTGAYPQQGYTPQSGVAGGTYPQQVAPGYGQPTSNQFPTGGLTYPQQSTYPQGPQQVYSPQTGISSTGYPSQPGYSPQGGQSTAGVAPGTNLIPGGGTYPTGTQLGTLSPQGGGSFSNQGSGGAFPPLTTSPNGGVVPYPYPPGTSFTTQGIPIGQGNVNYPPGSNYPFILTGGTGTPGGQLPPSGLPGSPTNIGQTQGGGISSGSQIPPIDPASGESQSLSSLNINPNGTKAAASAQGKTRNGMANVQISGSYTGSFSAQAQTSDNEKSVQAEIFGNTTAASSASQGKAGKSDSQSQILYNYNTGATLAESQGSGINYNTNSQIQVGNRGGIADAQSTGSGGSSSQAQIGFLPSDPKRKDQTALFEGGGTSSSQNSASSGQSQTQLQGSFRSGVSFTGSAQSNSGRAPNKTKLAFDPSDLSYPLDDSSKPNSLVEQSAKQVVKKENNIVKSTVPLSSLPQNDHSGASKSPVSDYDSPQHQDAVIKTQKYDAYIERDSSDMTPALNAGDLVPGTDNYRIPTGFRGRVASTAGDMTHASASSLGNAQSQTVLLKPGKGRVTINNRNRADQPNFQNDANVIGDKRNSFDEYVTVTKSETGELSGNKKFSHSYYTKSSTCGYFTFTCNYVDGTNGKSKICKPGPLTYSDGTPC